MTPDVTVLVAASRSDHPHHPVALRWLEDALAACSLGQRLTVLPVVAAGFLRLVTHPRVFVEPTPLAAAQGFLGALLAVEGVQVVALSGEWPLLEPFCREHQLVGNAISDGWIAAAVLASREPLVIFDRDFVSGGPGRWRRAGCGVFIVRCSASADFGPVSTAAATRASVSTGGRSASRCRPCWPTSPSR